MTVFLDTVGLLAVWDESDQWHQAAQACFVELLAGRADLVTSSFVLLECGNAPPEGRIAPQSPDCASRWSRGIV
jgi:predicted nucleic acid-binding protein